MTTKIEEAAKVLALHPPTVKSVMTFRCSRCGLEWTSKGVAIPCSRCPGALVEMTGEWIDGVRQ